MPVSQILCYDIDDGGRGWGNEAYDAEEEDEYIKK